MPRPPRDPAALVEAARTGDRSALARALSLVEQGGEPAREVGRPTESGKNNDGKSTVFLIGKIG